VILRVVNLLVVGALLLAAAYVYRIKFEATVQAERLAKLRDEVRLERDKIAALRAEWSELDEPARVQALAQRFLKLSPIVPAQYDSLAHLPAVPPALPPTASKDPIGGMIAHFGASGGSAPGAAARAAAAPARPARPAPTAAHRPSHP